MHLLVIAAGSFAAVGALALLAPNAGRQLRPLTPIAAVAFAVAGAVASPAATGISSWDAALRALLAAGAVVAAAHAPSWVSAVAAAVALATAGTEGAAAELAAAGFGIAFGAAASRFDSSLICALAAGFATQAAFRLQGPAGPRSTAYAATGVFVVLLVGGALKMPSKARRAAVKAGAAAVGFALVAGLLGILSAALARPAVEAGIRAASTGLDAARESAGSAAASELTKAGKDFDRARSRLDAWWARPALAVPAVARQSRALRAMAASGAALARTGARAVEAVDTKDLQLAEGAVPLDRLQALRRPAREAFAALASADARLDEVRSPWLVTPVATRLATLATRVDNARASVRGAMAAFEIAPALLGAQGPRHYFLAIQTPAEARGSGGFIGNFGELSADAGRLTLDKVGRTADLNTGGDPASRKLIAPPDYTSRYARFDVDLLWQNITMSPDFPTVARTIAGLYPQSGGREVDGVIAIDPLGLAALLKVLGPIEVAGWPVPITADNAAQILLFDQYVKLEGNARLDFLGRVTATVWQRLTTTSINIAELVEALGPIITEKHLMLASTHAREQRSFQELGIGGAMAPVRGDFLGLVTQNASASKIDWFLRRAVAYRARVDPATGEISSTATITLRNDAPTADLPDYVIGNQITPPLPKGTNKLYLSVYSPLFLAGAKVNGTDLLMESELERNRHVYSTYVTIPAGATATIEVDLVGHLDTKNGYRLDLHRQPFLAPDVATISLEVPKGWRLGRGGDSRTRSRKLELRADKATTWILRRSG